MPEGQDLRRRDGEPLFAEPWQAECMALAQRLVELGHVSAAKWSTALAEEIRHAAAAGAPDTAESYYAAALRALESLTIEIGLLTPLEIAEMKQAWAEAYRRTPHGQPVKLQNPAAHEGTAVEDAPDKLPPP
jgi:nitrile hydratase accessory protein